MPDERLPFFSVVVPTYRRPAPLALCLDAVASLDYPRDRLEVIVVDDGGGAPLEDVVTPFRASVELTHLTQENRGPAAARNAGARAARGTAVAFTDDDCLPARGWLRALAAGLESYPEAAVGGPVVSGAVQNPYARASQTIVDLVYAHYNEDPGNARFFASNNVAFPVGLFLDAGGFDESFRMSEDRELCDRWLALGRRLLYAPEATVVHVRELDLAGFVRQHFAYGRGAVRFHQTRARRASSSFKGHASFHLRLLGRLRDAGALRSPSLLALLAAWQLANALGFGYEGARLAARAGRRAKQPSLPRA